MGRYGGGTGEERNDRMKTYYFTFGSDKRFPYQNGYMTIEAESRDQAIAMFRSVHPDREKDSDTYNASDCYSIEDWEQSVKKYYAGMAPFETINRDIKKGEKNETF